MRENLLRHAETVDVGNCIQESGFGMLCLRHDDVRNLKPYIYFKLLLILFLEQMVPYLEYPSLYAPFF